MPYIMIITENGGREKMSVDGNTKEANKLADIVALRNDVRLTSVFRD